MPVVTVKEETITVWITNDNGSKSSVVLLKEINQRPGYFGPRGEYYSRMPSNEQLRVLYGIRSATAKKENITLWITNDNGSQTPVTLVPSGAGFFGPTGEYYASMPTEEQLKALYGLPSNASIANTVTVWLELQRDQGSGTIDQRGRRICRA